MKKTYLLTGIVLLSYLFILSCANKQDEGLLQEVKDYQAEIDAMLKVVDERRKDIRHKIEEISLEAQDTFSLARNLIPLKTANIRLSARYDALSDALESYHKKEIDASALRTNLKEKKEAIEAIVLEYELK